MTWILWSVHSFFKNLSPRPRGKTSHLTKPQLCETAREIETFDKRPVNVSTGLITKVIDRLRFHLEQRFRCRQRVVRRCRFQLNIPVFEVGLSIPRFVEWFGCPCQFYSSSMSSM